MEAPISRRFGLVQKRGKIRLIDDFSESGVNSCVGVVESLFLHTVDIACALLKVWFDECRVHGSDSGLDTRTYDLASAYRQIGLRASGRGVAYLRVYDPTTCKMRIFQATVLPFGAVRSVHWFFEMRSRSVVAGRCCLSNLVDVFL